MEKKPKTAYTFKPKKNEVQEIITFLEIQSNLNDAIRYLIEKEIAENGVRNLGEFIPSVRNINSLLGFKKQVSNVAELSIQEALATLEIKNEEIIEKLNRNNEIIANTDSKENEKGYVPNSKEIEDINKENKTDETSVLDGLDCYL